MAGTKEPCEICGKRKKKNKMVEYYIEKRSNEHKIMYKCKKCSDPEEKPMEE